MEASLLAQMQRAAIVGVLYYLDSATHESQFLTDLFEQAGTREYRSSTLTDNGRRSSITVNVSLENFYSPSQVNWRIKFRDPKLSSIEWSTDFSKWCSWTINGRQASCEYLGSAVPIDEDVFERVYAVMRRDVLAFCRRHKIKLEGANRFVIGATSTAH
ncbi:hypothetical protein HJC99_05060 [Candidatus Saccharibacteria bacterium]|nr:hypothetical protein [Candidatus Saccharibacteria bacterium]